MRYFPLLVLFLITVAAIARGNEAGGGVMGGDVQLRDQGATVVLVTLPYSANRPLKFF